MIHATILDEYRNPNNTHVILCEKIWNPDSVWDSGYRVKAVEIRYFRNESICRQHFRSLVKAARHNKDEE